MNEIKSIDDISFDKDLLFANINGFFHFGMNWDAHYEKIAIIENSLSEIHTKLIKSIRNRGHTHTHKKSMMNAYKSVLSIYKIQFFHSIGYYDKALSEMCLYRFNKHKELIDRLSNIILTDFTHREQYYLIKPYWFKFANKCGVHRWNRYGVLREALKEKIIKKVLKYVENDTEASLHIDERIRPLFVMGD